MWQISMLFTRPYPNSLSQMCIFWRPTPHSPRFRYGFAYSIQARGRDLSSAADRAIFQSKNHKRATPASGIQNPVWSMAQRELRPPGCILVHVCELWSCGTRIVDMIKRDSTKTQGKSYKRMVERGDTANCASPCLPVSWSEQAGSILLPEPNDI
jgi:hypothetical protein